MEGPELLTRRSLVDRLKDLEDQRSWQDFFDTYWRLIYGTARKAGLTESEAEEVVQETVITVARTMNDFHYDPQRCTFKGWLLRLTRFRILDQLRKRKPAAMQHSRPDGTGTGTATVERVPDPKGGELERVWEEEWTESVFHAAMDRVKRRVNPLHFQVFYLNVVENVGMREVARTMRVNVAMAYMAKSRVRRLITQEVKRLEGLMGDNR